MVSDDVRRMGHLMRRAGFGASLPELQRRSQAGISATIADLLDGAAKGDDGKSDWVLEAAIDRDPEQLLRPQSLKPWWIYRMITTDQPLLEKMVLFWHGHFATSASKVANANYMLQQNRFFRDNALGNWRDMLKGISRDPAMIMWLDNNTNFKAHANENYAREVMELFSLGIGHYTEDDIKQSGRAFTGWNQRGGEFFFRPTDHDTGLKTFMGHTGNFDGDDIIDIILEQPAAAEFLARKLFVYLAYDNPSPAVIQPIAETFRRSNYSIRTLVNSILTSSAFWSAQAWNTQVKSPADLVVGTLRTLGYGQGVSAPAATASDPTMAPDGAMNRAPSMMEAGMGEAGRMGGRGGFALAAMAASMKQMGQELFFPPNVKGWDGGLVWINSATMMERVNFAMRMANTLKPQEGPGSLVNLVGDMQTANPQTAVDGLLANLGPLELPDKERTTLVEAVSGGGKSLAANTDRGYQRAGRLRLAVGLAMQSPQYQMC